LVSLILLSTGCVPIPIPIRVSNEESPPSQFAPLKPPKSNELLACLVGTLTKERADVQIADANSVWEALTSVPERGVSIDSLLDDRFVRAQLAEQRVDYMIAVQRDETDSEKRGWGTGGYMYGSPVGFGAGLVGVDHHLSAVVHATAGEFRDEAAVTAHEREGGFGFYPIGWFMLFPIGDPESRACKALGLSLAEVIPTSDAGGSVSVILFELEWPFVPPHDVHPPVIRGVPIPLDARVVLANVLWETEEPGATVTHFDDQQDPCALQVDARTIKNARRFEENLTASEDVAGWTRLPETNAYRIEIATQSRN
jgi:hypothetical protein